MTLFPRLVVPAGSKRWMGGLAVTAAGLLLFVHSVRLADADVVLDRLRNVGWGFVAVLAFSGLRYLVRSAAWILCLEVPAHLPLRDAFLAVVGGDALGNLTPFGILVSEPTKALLVRRHVSLVSVSAAITLENLFYSLSVLGVISVGTLVVLTAFSVPREVFAGVVLLLATATALMAAAAWVVLGRSRLASRLLVWLRRRGAARQPIDPLVESIRSLETLMHEFLSRHRRRLWSIALLEASFHAAAVAEVWVILVELGLRDTTWPTLFALEYVNRIVTIAFNFIPFRLGVDETGAGAAAAFLGMGSATGVTMAIVRKLRVLFWSLCGLVFFAARALSERRHA